MVFVAVFQFISLQHALHGSVTALGKKSNTNITFHDKVCDMGIQIFAVVRDLQRLDQLVLVVN